MTLLAAAADGRRIRATPGEIGCCVSCDEPLIPKCGSLVIHHWAHHARRDCDPWTEPETDWHLGWKAEFPPDCVEVPVGDHRADVKLGRLVVEFQHSPISVLTIRERERHYGLMAWVFDGRRWAERMRPYHRYRRNANVRWSHAPKSLATCLRPVFIDLGEPGEIDDHGHPIPTNRLGCRALRLCWLRPGSGYGGYAVVDPIEGRQALRDRLLGYARANGWSA